MTPRLFHADAIVVGDDAPIRDGAVVVDGTGLVLDVGPADEIRPRHAGAAVERVAGVVFPGLVNAHAHVELSLYRGRVTGGRGFVDWVDRFIAVRAETPRDEEDEAIDAGVRELESFVTTAVGDVTNTLGAVRGLAAAGIGGCVFHEALGVARAQAMRRVEALEEERVSRLSGWTPSLAGWEADLTYAPAPHTLYTTHPDAVRALLANARARGVRTSLHLAEHPAERRAIEHGDGPVHAWLAERLRVKSEDFTWPRVPLFDYADSLGALGPDVLLVHLTDARPEELARVAERGSPVVVCPRSNLYIEGKLPPLLAMRAAGLEPALGSDSLASNASLDVLADARALADRFPGVPARDLLRMATWNGARALGRPDLGRITRGARPGIACVNVDGAARVDSGDDGCAFLLRHVKSPRSWLARRDPNSRQINLGGEGT